MLLSVEMGSQLLCALSPRAPVPNVCATSPLHGKRPPTGAQRRRLRRRRVVRYPRVYRPCRAGPPAGTPRGRSWRAAGRAPSLWHSAIRLELEGAVSADRFKAVVLDVRAMTSLLRQTATTMLALLDPRDVAIAGDYLSRHQTSPTQALEMLGMEKMKKVMDGDENLECWRSEHQVDMMKMLEGNKINFEEL